MMRSLLAALLVMLVPVIAVAQVNTTGSLSPTTLTQAQTPTNGTTGTTNGGTTTNGTTTGTTNGTAEPTAATARDAAIVLCAQDFSTGALVVFSASLSAGGATVSPGAPCAQALSDLFVAGYGIIDVQPFNQQLQYTLVR
jgi:hypothetical protein